MTLEWVAVDDQPIPPPPPPPRRRPALLAVCVATLLIGVLLLARQRTDIDEQLADESEPPPTTAISSTTDVEPLETDDRVNAFPPDGFLRRWQGDEVLAIVEPGEPLWLIDLATGGRTALEPPEPLVSATVSTLDTDLVIVGESTAWRVDLTNRTWSPLGDAFDTRQSSIGDRVWLGTTPQWAEESQTQWDEVDADGQVVRSVVRAERLPFDTPELVWSSVHLYKMVDEMPIRWQSISMNALPLAFGENDVVTRECIELVECGLVWYDIDTLADRGALHRELAENIPERTWPVLNAEGEYIMSRLSPDQRFVAQPTADAQHTTVTSIVSGETFNLPCRWDRPLRWTSGAELLACRGDAGIELFDTQSNSRVGTAWPLEAGSDASVVFIERPAPPPPDGDLITPPVTQPPADGDITANE